MILLFAFLVIIIFGYIANIWLENYFRCSYCGKFFFKKDNWHRKGALGHPENIVNICNGCHGKGWKNIERKSSGPGKGWEKIESKSDGPLSWTEYTDHDGVVYTIYDMRINPATPGAYMKGDED